jgi:hypothetical protein
VPALVSAFLQLEALHRVQVAIALGTHDETATTTSSAIATISNDFSDTMKVTCVF